MHKIQYMAIVEHFRDRAKVMRELEMPRYASAYMDDTAAFLTDPMPADADQMIERTEVVQQLARRVMLQQRQAYAITGDEEFRDRAEILCAVAFGLSMARTVALSLIGVEDL